MAKLSKKHAVFLLFAPFVCSKPAIDSGSGDSADIDLFEASGPIEVIDTSDNFFFDDDDDSAQNLDEESFFDNEEDKELVKSFKSSPNETEKNFFQGTGKAVNIEKAIWNAPMLANTKDFLSNSAILTHVKKNRNLYSTIFANTLLPSKYSLLGDGIFIMNGETALNDELQRNYEMAYKQSSLASFGDNLDTVRPFLAYALGISWNVEFYEINQPLLDKRRKIQGDVQVDIIKDEKYKITDAAKEYFSNIYSKGQDSEVSSRLRLVEFNFEQFVVDVRVWCVRSLGSAYEVVKNVQRAMKSVIKQDEYMDYASKLSPTDPQRIEMLQAVIAKRGNMAQALAKTLPILDGLMTEVETLEYSMERGIRSVLKDAQVKTKEEVKIARDQDRDHRLTNSSIFRQLKKTNQWLSTNENKMRVTEQKINQIAVDIDRKLEVKRDAHQRFQVDLKKANAEIAENEEERLEVFKKFNEDIMKFHEHLKKKQEESHCKIDLSKQITGLVTVKDHQLLTEPIITALAVGSYGFVTDDHTDLIGLIILIPGPIKPAQKMQGKK
jgi:ribonuclease I